MKFGRSGDVLVPPTLDRDAVKRAIAGLQLEQYTAIGEGVFACLDAMSTFSRTSTTAGEKPAPARIVLLSDGYNTVGRKVSEAAAAAKKANTPVSTIAFGTDGGTVDVRGPGQPVPSDKVTLRGLAEATGGSFHTAASVDELKRRLQGHRLPDRLHQGAARHQLAVHVRRPAAGAGRRRDLAALVRPAQSNSGRPAQCVRSWAAGSACRCWPARAAPGARRPPRPRG